MPRYVCFAGLMAFALAYPASAEPLTLKAGETTFTIDAATLRIDAARQGETSQPVMPPQHDAEAAVPVAIDKGWRWKDAEGRTYTASTEGDALKLVILAPFEQKLSWALPPATTGTWLVPDGEGMAFQVDDAFWRQHNQHEHCFDATAGLSFPAWSYLNSDRAVIYTLGDGLRSELCLKDDNGLQARLSHNFDETPDGLEILFAIRSPDPLAPAIFYRDRLKVLGQFKTLTDKAVPDLERLYGAPQAYVWGDGRDLAFLDDLKALGIERINLSYDQNPEKNTHVVRRPYLEKARALGYLAGPYDVFDNGQPPGEDTPPYVLWDKSLYPSGCVLDAAGKVVTGFAGMGCEMSSEAVVRAPGAFVPGVRYAQHRAEGANQIFVDVDAYGEFYHDYSPDHPMTMMRDRDNRLARLSLGMTKYQLVIGSENATAWSAGVVHYSHGTAQAHVSTVWKVKQDQKRFGGWWPSDRLPMFFKTFPPTEDESRLLFGAADRLPLFDAVFHDSVIASDRWEFGLMKVSGMEGLRFARALLYGTPTLWPLDRQEIRRTGPWLKAAHDDFRIAHGWNVPVALTGFRWETPDRLVQTTSFADGRTITANFAAAPFQGLATNCVRVKWPEKTAIDLCPPALPAP